MKNTFADRVLAHHFDLKPSLVLPDGVEWLYPYERPEVREAMGQFFTKYFAEGSSRVALLGINPGRFGAGITGIPFTDPIRMEKICALPNAFDKRQELSSVFVYDVVDALGGPDLFYRSFYITSICPLGFVRDGKNYNYYDSKSLTETVMPMILHNLRAHLEMGVSEKVAFSMGQGKNYKFLKALNDEHGFFEQVHPLPHPRWVMQYRLKRKEAFVQAYVNALSPWQEKGESGDSPLLS